MKSENHLTMVQIFSLDVLQDFSLLIETTVQSFFCFVLKQDKLVPYCFVLTENDASLVPQMSVKPLRIFFFIPPSALGLIHLQL